MTREEKIEQIRQRARKNFSLGYNCAECVTEAVLSLVDTGLPPEVKKVATGFGGGVGLFGDTCGAITGAVIAVGTVHGRSALPEGEGKEAAKKSAQQLYGKPGLYRLFNQIPNKLQEKFGNTLCRELTSKWKDQWLCRDHALFCRELITEAAGVAAELALSDRDEAASRPFGKNVENLKDEGECAPGG
ncbi:MAG: C-GCAxxG-C-C family protein [Syntrophales bacterium]|nr:C-GCAxxG-C-C family protein [Syntrophales bacterium]MDD5233646.1 C-GCAxxG-C-C family protein [Syntrophales bacterium]HPL63580.1 C-GCAxxG-C-C family protein [Syntrophales bacterium]